MALPVPIHGGHHMLGRVGVCPDETFSRLVVRLLGLLSKSQGPTVILPPIPRYLAGGCCLDPTHAANTRESAHAHRMLEHCVRLRKLLKKELTSSSLSGFWVPDLVTGLAAAGTGGDNLQAKAESMCTLFNMDNVHLTPLGYARLSSIVIESIGCALKKGDTAECVISGERRNHYWRGFSSLRGSVKHGQSGLKTRVSTSYGKPMGSGYHPYKGGRGGGGRGHTGGQRGRRN